MWPFLVYKHLPPYTSDVDANNNRARTLLAKPSETKHRMIIFNLIFPTVVTHLYIKGYSSSTCYILLPCVILIWYRDTHYTICYTIANTMSNKESNHWLANTRGEGNSSETSMPTRWRNNSFRLKLDHCNGKPTTRPPWHRQVKANAPTTRPH